MGCWLDRGGAGRAITTLEGKCKRLKGSYRRRDAWELCYQCAVERGFKYMSLQDGGWCASSANAESRYKMYGRSRRCRGKGLGGPASNRVYKITGKILFVTVQLIVTAETVLKRQTYIKLIFTSYS